MSKEKVFIRSVKRIQDVRNEQEVNYAHAVAPHIFGDLILSVPVTATDTVSDLRKTLETMLTVRMDAGGLGFLGSLDISSDDWHIAIDTFLSHRPALALVDSNAAPYDDELGLCPTNFLIQIVPVCDEGAALDLYMEVLGDAINGENWSPELAPESYLSDTCFMSADGDIFSREEAAEDEGVSREGGKILTLKEVFESHQKNKI
ncbi:hypothetical protein HK19_02000 [Acetobacter persici]|uniref:hypothetical protein n=1 Tax=Acetobacter persici TaxID=1076596 RepID=UPI000B6D4A8B|nr:hypothetical protein [Acetobacter persici]OUI86824.1 hypothetical protein HK19_02000 [Acetobacter persici]